MIGVQEATWNLFIKETDNMIQSDSNLKFHKEKYSLYRKEFEEEYNHIKDCYMKNEVQFLDRHKVAAIIIVSLIKVEPISYYKKEKADKKIFIGTYFTAISVGLSFMLGVLNDKLESNKIKRIEKYDFPPQMCCDQSYFDVLCRNLYILNSENRLYPIDLANILFWIETYTLSKNGIDNTQVR